MLNGHCALACRAVHDFSVEPSDLRQQTGDQSLFSVPLTILNLRYRTTMGVSRSRGAGIVFSGDMRQANPARNTPRTSCDDETPEWPPFDHEIFGPGVLQCSI
jgi:hypothetical protein